MASPAGLRDLGDNQTAEQHAMAAPKGVSPPLDRTVGRAAATATFVRPPRNPPEWVAAAGAAMPRARGAGLPTVSAVPVLSLDREAGRGCAGVAPATVPAATTPAVQVAKSVCGTRRLSAMPAAALVEAFRATCEGHVADSACTPQGKALLQAALRTQRPEVLNAVVAELCPRLCDVSVDAHGCHVLRTLVEACTAEQTEALIGAMHASVVLNMCTASQYTRRTLQSLFERREVDLSALVRVLAENAGYLAATQQGCISLMRVFELCDAAQKAELVRELLPKLAALSMDAFANYMVQCAIEHSDRTTAAQYVLAHFSGNILQMSCNKHSSNVLEVALRCCGEVPAVRRLFLNELVFNPAALKEAVSDPYGNFVVQALIGVVTNPMEFKRMEDRLHPALVGCQFAAKIEGRVKAKRPGPHHAGGAPHHYSCSQSHQQRPLLRHLEFLRQPSQAVVPVGREEPCAVRWLGSCGAETREADGELCFWARASAVAPGRSSLSGSAKYFRHFPYELPRFVAPSFNSIGIRGGGIVFRRRFPQELQRQSLLQPVGAGDAV
ncbi:hypothetical protein CUR178_05943 [Leishmania enriettii]|uniref:PUM-HD domain-containing protein n=1 Tax=Leishmania enriettii TaxID=5663 RepID=A0A836HMN7_LEIEN|nr:hypothetical protein CUR178_05943 [Leishmania enriettii]